jgi:hypothetical protein
MTYSILYRVQASANTSAERGKRGTVDAASLKALLRELASSVLRRSPMLRARAHICFLVIVLSIKPLSAWRLSRHSSPEQPATAVSFPLA